MSRTASWLVGVLVLAAACGPAANERPTDYRAFTNHYALRIGTTPVPPRAREVTMYRVFVRDKNTGQPISNGEGIIYGETRDGAKVWDSLTPASEIGTYTARIRFVAAGEWAIGLQFRKDSTQALEKADWMQSVLPDTSSIP